MARINFILPDGNSRLMAISIFLRFTAIIDFSLPHGKNQFYLPDGDSRLTGILIFLSLHSDNQFFFLSLIVACSPCLSSFELNGF
jgi:hypothetical protein